MPNELILRYFCAVLIILLLFMLFLWRVAKEEAENYKKEAFMSSEHLARMIHENQKLSSQLEKILFYGS